MTHTKLPISINRCLGTLQKLSWYSYLSRCVYVKHAALDMALQTAWPSREALPFHSLSLRRIKTRFTAVRPQHRQWTLTQPARSNRSTASTWAAAGSLQPQEPGRARTPHSGYHFDGSGRRFFEGWCVHSLPFSFGLQRGSHSMQEKRTSCWGPWARRYWRVTLPGDGQSFALIYSIENPQGNLPYSGVGAQVMGPDDGYLIQYSPNVNTFWADRNSLALGAVFQPASPSLRLASLKRVLPQVGTMPDVWRCHLATDATYGGNAGAPGRLD
jgi:hypothetical protein